MFVNSGYLIPENPSPSNNRCVRVYVPNDPLYMAALLGTLTYLGQWTAWERDALHRGSLAADSWKNANDLTLDGLSLPCGENPITDEEMSEILDKLEEINSRLTEIEDMNVTVTQTVNGCGCGDGGTSTTTNQTDGVFIDPDDTGIIPPYMTDPVVIVDSAKCRAANYLVMKVSYMVRSLADLGGTGQVIFGIVMVISGLLTWLTPIIGDEIPGTAITISGIVVIATRIAVLFGMTDFVWDFFDDIADKLDDPEDKQAAICSLYDWDNAFELGENLTGWLNSKVDELDTSTEIKIAIKEIFGLLFGAQLVNWFVEHISSIVPADFVPQYDCICGATGDTCPTQNIVLAGLGNFPAGDLTGTTQGFASQFNGTTGYHEIIFELSANYCVTIENGAYTPNEAHEKCSDGVMVASDGSCIRRFVARSGDAFGTAVTFDGISDGCYCADLRQYAIAVSDNNFAVDFENGEELEAGRVYTIRGSGNDVTKHGTAFSSFSIVKVGGGSGSALFEIATITAVQLSADAGTNKEHSFWIPFNDETCNADWGYDFIPQVGYTTPSHVEWLQMRGVADVAYEVGFRFLSVRDKQCP